MMRQFLLLTISAIILICFSECKNDNLPYDSLFPWPSSGNREVDSLIYCLEYANYPEEPYKDRIADKLSIYNKICSIATNQKGNERIQIRKEYARILNLGVNSNSINDKLDSLLEVIDSAAYPYEYHKFLTLKINQEKEDIVYRHNIVLGNIAFFSKLKAYPDEGRNLLLAGKIMHELGDSVMAREYSERSCLLLKEIGFHQSEKLMRSNLILMYPTPTRDEEYLKLVQDTTLESDPEVYARILKNAFIISDSIKFLYKALSLYGQYDLKKNYLPTVMGEIGNYYTQHKNPALGLEYIRNALDSARKYDPNNISQLLMLERYKATAFQLLNQNDSCIAALLQAQEYNDLYLRQLNQPGVYASDAAIRIKMAEHNARLERQREISILVIMLLSISLILLWLLFRMRRHRQEKIHQELLMQERHERNLQSIRAQSKVMEENDRLVETIEGKINELKKASRIPDDSANDLNRILILHKSNEDSRQGFLKVQQELDTRFFENLKYDFPNLSESQTKLASLIASGLDSRQISNILNIEISSVHTNRYRLRSRLGLTKDQNLEEFLRRYNRPI